LLGGQRKIGRHGRGVDIARDCGRENDFTHE
jgi:hypothetical protein